ncbi:MAG: DUF3327 domain-containing protein [Thermomicrobiales bacterium]|nr:DUF3327 domain-containing protein [Thermomicrobiales bacterium]
MDSPSPRLQQLIGEIESNPDAVVQFWEEITATGTPLIESDGEHTDRYLVTFLWRETEPLQNVTMLEWFSVEDMTLQAKQLRKIEDTDIWYRTLTMAAGLCTSYRMVPNDSLVNLRGDPNFEERFKNSRIDPLNALKTIDNGDESGYENSSLFILPGAPVYEGIALTEQAPAAEFSEHTIHSHVMDQERRFWLHQPEAGTSTDWLLIQLDAEMVRESMRFPQIVSVIGTDSTLPSVSTVFVDTSDRAKDLPCNAEFADFVADELLPYVCDALGKEFPSERVIVAGQSYSGLAAAWIGLYRHDAVGNVLAQSGSFWWWPEYDDDNEDTIIGQTVRHCWLPTWTSQQPATSTRFWLEAGILEDHTEGKAPSLLTAHRTMRDVLIAKGNDVAYREYAGGHDLYLWRGLYLDGIRHLLNRDSSD